MGQLVAASSALIESCWSATMLTYVMWWNTKRPPTVLVGPSRGMSLISLTSRADTYRSSGRPVGMSPTSPHQSGPRAGTATSLDFRTRSGSPMVHLSESSKLRGGGMSDGLPRGAPASTHFTILEISWSDNEGSFLN